MALVRESIEFHRGGDPKRKIGIGRQPLTVLEVYYFGDSNFAHGRTKQYIREVKHLLNNWEEEINDDYDFLVKYEDNRMAIVNADELEKRGWVEYRGVDYKVGE